MSNCPECGEKVAGSDVFCSYCGITLTPTAESVDDPSTSAPVVAAPVEPSVSAEPTPADEPLPQAIPSPFADASANELLPRPEEAPVPPSVPIEAAPVAPVTFDAPPLEVVPNEVSDPEPKVAPESIAASELANEFRPAVSEPVFSTPAAPVSFSDEIEEPAVAGEMEPIAIEEPAEEPFEAEAVPEDAASEVDFSNIDEAPIPKVILDLPAAEPSADAPPFADLPEPPLASSPDAISESPVDEPAAEAISAELPESAPESVQGAVSESPASEEPNAPEESPSSREALDVAAPELPVSAAADELALPAPEFTPPPAEPVAVVSSLADAVDPEMIETLETRVPFFAETEAGAVVETPEPAPVAESESATPVPSVAAAEVPSSTKPHIGNADTDGRKAAKLKPLDEGTVLNSRYEIVRKIGGGGMGAVYLANDRNLGGILRAVKEMVQSYIEAEQQEKAVSDFQREAMILTNLEHPSIPTIFDYFFDDKEGRFYLVMKYISGGDLSARLRANPEGRLDEKTVTEWAIQIADVLEYLHRQDPLIVYRDLKPANIMIDGNTGRLMLIDFGIARSINKEEKGVTAVGTMGYAPPELFSGNVEARSDIYSLGSTMFHLLTGADPQSNPLLIFDFQKNPRPRQINPQLSDQIEQILMRSVEYNADLRFKSAAELRSALEEHLLNLQSGKVSYGVKAVPSAISFSDQLVFCGFCGKQIVASDVFCAFCGSQQPIAQQSFHQAPVVAPVAAATAKLYVVLTNDLESAGFTLEKDENLIGRRDPMSNIFPEVDLSKFDPQTKISRRHARIRREGASFLLEDLGSSNGTILITGADSARLLPHQPRLLTNGDRVRVGDTTLHFTMN